MKGEKQRVTELNDAELMELTGGASFISTAAAIRPGFPHFVIAYGIVFSPLVRALYGISPDFGIQVANNTGTVDNA